MALDYTEVTHTAAGKRIFGIWCVDDGAGPVTKPATPKINAAVTQFNTYLTAPVYENLNGVADSTSARLSVPLTMAAQANGVTVTMTDTHDHGSKSTSAAASAGRWAYTGTGWIDNRIVAAPDYTVMQFSPNNVVRAWACVFTDVGDFDNSRLTYRLVDANGAYIDWTPATPYGTGSPYDGQGFFIGVRASFAIAEVRFIYTGTENFIDQFGYTYYTAEIASGVTALPAAPLPLSNIAAVAAARKRRKKLRRGCG